MTTEQTLAVRSSDTLSIPQLVAQVNLIQEAMSAVMHSGEHYGVIPGTGTKPSLLKPGAEKLCQLFRLDPQYEWTETVDGLHRTYTVKCTLYHIPSGNRIASGLGSCSTRESKYAYRKAERTCPECGGTTIIKGRAEYGGGWLCYAKKGGCGSKWPDGAEIIERQETGRAPNENLPDAWNTVLKMGCKRALVAAVLNATAASDIFTQDIEEMAENATVAAPATEAAPKAPPPPPKPSTPPANTAPMPQSMAMAPHGVCPEHKAVMVMIGQKVGHWRTLDGRRQACFAAPAPSLDQQAQDVEEGFTDVGPGGTMRPK